MSDNYRKVATVLLDFIGMKDFLCSDDTCSNLDGTLLFLIHILTMKIFTYSVMYYKERYSQRKDSKISEKYSGSIKNFSVADQKILNIGFGRFFEPNRARQF